MTSVLLMKNLFRTRSLPIFFLAVITVGLSLAKFWESWTVNLWSIAYLSQSLSMENGGTEILQAPERHQRAPVWLARDAIGAGEPDSALELLKPLLSSGKIMVLSVQAEALAASGDFDGAVNTWVRAGDFLSLLKVAQENEANGLLENAEQAYEGALQVNSLRGSLPLTYFYWHVKGDSVAAERVLRRSLGERHSSHLHRLRTLGLILEAQSRWEEALAVYKDALHRKPDDIYTLRLLGFAYFHGKDDYDAAIGIFTQMIEIEPAKGEGYFAIGQLMAEVGHYDESEQWFIQGLQSDPDRPDLWVMRANAARQAQNLSLALDIYDYATQQFPDYSLLYHEMAWAYKLDGNPGQAIQSIEQALALHHSPPVWYFMRAGAIYEWAGDRDLAIKVYEQALAIVPMNPRAQDALRRLHSNGD